MADFNSSLPVSGTATISAGVDSVFGISGTVVGISGIINFGAGVGSVLNLFTDSSNVLDSPLVANGSYLMVAGSISSMPSISTSEDSVYKVSGTWEGIGSLTFVGANFNGSVYPLRVEGGSELLTVGSVFQGTSVWTTSGTATVSAGVDSVFGISGTVVGVSGIVNLGEQWTGVGSVVISGTSIPVSRGVGSVLLVSTAGSVAVYSDSTLATAEGARENLVTDYNTDVSIVAGESGLHLYVSTGSFYLSRVIAGFSGKGKISVHISGAGAEDTFATAFNSTANPNILLDFGEANGLFVGNGSKLIIERNNRDSSSQDVYSTIIGYTII